jgi:chaperonin cofactor prefoldin
MANIKKTVEKKEENIEVKQEVVNTQTENIKEEPKAGKRISGNRFKNNNMKNLDPKRIVPVTSMVGYPVGYQCKLSPVFLSWEGYGEEHTMSIEEIGMMNSEYSGFLQDPIFMIDDEEFAEVYNLNEKYELIFELEDLNEFYNQRVIEIEKKMDKLSPEIRNNLILRTLKMVDNGELNNIGIVKMLKRKYGINVEI